MAKVLLVKASHSFVEPSCSYPTPHHASYSFMFQHLRTVFLLAGFDVRAIEAGIDYRTIGSSLMPMASLTESCHIAKKLISFNARAYEDCDSVVVMGGLFARADLTGCISALSTDIAESGIPVVRVGNFAGTERLFSWLYPTVDHIGFIDSDPVPPVLDWLKSVGVIDEDLHNAACGINSQLLSDRADPALVNLASQYHISNISDHFLSHPAALKQRVLSIGFGCPQSCTFCPSRLTVSSFYNYQYIAQISDFFRRAFVDSCSLTDWLHADPLVNKEAFLRLCREVRGAGEKAHKRIQTRLALLKNLSSNELVILRDAGVRLIYVGLETIDYDVSKRGKKLNNTVDDFFDLHSMLGSYGIKLVCNLVVGLPGESIASLGAMSSFVREHADKIGNCAPFRPIPGTPDGNINYLETFLGELASELSGLGTVMPDRELELLAAYICVFQSRYVYDKDSKSLAHLPSGQRAAAAAILKLANNKAMIS